MCWSSGGWMTVAPLESGLLPSASLTPMSSHPQPLLIQQLQLQPHPAHHIPQCVTTTGTNEALVVCRQLGFSSGTPYTQSHWGDVPDVFSFDNVGCDGTEDHLVDCPHLTSDNCTGDEGAG